MSFRIHASALDDLGSARPIAVHNNAGGLIYRFVVKAAPGRGRRRLSPLLFQRPTMTTMLGRSTRPFVDHGGQPSRYNTILGLVILGLVALVAVGRQWNRYDASVAERAGRAEGRLVPDAWASIGESE